MENSSLARRSSGQLAIGKQSSPGSLARMLDLAAKMTSYELMPEEGRLWAQKLSNQPPEAIEWAFSNFLETGRYFPKPAEISERIKLWHTQRKQSETDRLMDECRQTREKLKEAGLLSGEDQIQDLRTRILQVARKLPDTPPTRRQELKQRLDAALTKRAEDRSRLKEVGSENVSTAK
jgi:hypothetical protein